jgi:hypothetical protein
MKIVVVTDFHELIQARVTRSSKRSIVRFKINGRYQQPPRYPGGTPSRLRLRDEGETWCRGWESTDVDALRAQMMLKRSTL